MGDILVGTSGYSYDDWVGYFYPQGTRKGEMLGYYQSKFSTVEVNSSFYSVPSRQLVSSWISRSPQDFCFVLKAHRSMSHEGGGEDAFHDYQVAVEPLLARGQLGALLLQFPWSFASSQENSEHLRAAARWLRGWPVVVEFRNVGWATEQTQELLRELNLGFCCVDEPKLRGLMPPLAVATSPIGYVRFHGRNAAKWWHHEQAYERYDYLYSKDELAEWLPKIRKLAQETERLFVFFNNHYQGKAPANAAEMIELLRSQ